MNLIDKPIKPAKRIVTKGSANYHFYHVSSKVSLISFLEWCKEVIPKGAMDVTIELKENQYEEDGDEVWIEIAWEKEIKNKDFDKELKKYKKQLAKWDKQNGKS
jgi:hypothetical protein